MAGPKDALRGRLIAVMGGSGFLGQYVVQELLRAGARVRIAARDPQRAYELKPMANLGQLQLARVDANDQRSLQRAIDGTDGVINLIGTFTGNLARVMGEAAGWMAEAAAKSGAQAFVHVSALVGADEAVAGGGVDDDDRRINGYAAAKALGEARVRAAFPNATIVRPSILFGEDDNFLNMFAGLIQRLPVLPVFGPDAQLQPAYVDDVAQALVLALADPGRHGGTIFELGGPDRLTMLAINRRIAEAQRRRRTFLPMPDAVSNVFAILPGTPMSPDQWDLLRRGNVVSGRHAGFAAFDIAPRPLDLFLDRWMVRYRKHGRFAERLSG